MTNPTTLYVGKREAVIAEVGTLDCYVGKFLIQPCGDENFDAEGADTKAEAKEIIKYLRSVYPGVEVCWV